MDTVIAGLLEGPAPTRSFTQGNVEAMLQSGRIWSEGVLVLSKSIAETSKAQLDDVMATWKALSGVTSAKEAMDLHAALARTAFQKSVESTGKITQASMKLMEQTMAPIAARVTAAADSFTASTK